MDQAQGVLAQGLKTPVRDPGSFRDPSGFVCRIGNEVFRAVDETCLSLFRRIEQAGLLPVLEQSGGLVPTRVVEPDEEIGRASCRERV